MLGEKIVEERFIAHVATEELEGRPLERRDPSLVTGRQIVESYNARPGVDEHLGHGGPDEPGCTGDEDRRLEHAIRSDAQTSAVFPIRGSLTGREGRNRDQNNVM